MTKITPHQMRELANALEGVEDALPANTGVHIIVARDFLRTAADRLEAVQGCADEVDRLRAVIENAPHAADCDYLPGDEEYAMPVACTCWKADAL